MSTEIRTPSRQELDKRIGRFTALQPMSTAKDLEWMPQAAKDIVFARKIMPIILEDTKNPFGNSAPIMGAAGATMYISVLPPGQGPCLHAHNSTYETFMVLEGKIEFSIGDVGQEKRVLDKWDLLSCPSKTYRGFRNVDSQDSVLLTVISGLVDARDDVSCPWIVAEQLKVYGDDVFEAIEKIVKFDTDSGKSTGIYNPTPDQLKNRLAYFDKLQAMSVESDLAWVPRAAMDIIYARKIMPIILEDTKNPFGNIAPVFGAGGMTMFISIMPPGQGPCLHSHNGTYETFFVLEGSIEYHIGDPIEHRVTLNKWDCLSVPPQIYRGFRNVGAKDCVQLTVITGAPDARDDVSMPYSIAEQVKREHGDKVLDSFKTLFHFDPPNPTVSPAA